jgi:heat shock protein HslJ
MTRKTLFIFGLLYLGVFVTTGCQLGEDQKADPLGGSTWELFSYRKTRPIEGTLITAEFQDGQIRGTGGCNTYSGSYQIDGSQIKFEAIGWTAMACLDPDGVMEQETLVMDFLMNAERYELEEGRLNIYRTDGEALTFDRSN